MQVVAGAVTNSTATPGMKRHRVVPPNCAQFAVEFIAAAVTACSSGAVQSTVRVTTALGKGRMLHYWFNCAPHSFRMPQAGVGLPWASRQYQAATQFALQHYQARKVLGWRGCDTCARGCFRGGFGGGGACAGRGGWGAHCCSGGAFPARRATQGGQQRCQTKWGQAVGQASAAAARDWTGPFLATRDNAHRFARNPWP